MRSPDGVHQANPPQGYDDQTQVFLGNILSFGNIFKKYRALSIIKSQRSHQSDPVSSSCGKFHINPLI
jgi:hypothetical protein